MTLKLLLVTTSNSMTLNTKITTPQNQRYDTPHHESHFRYKGDTVVEEDNQDDEDHGAEIRYNPDCGTFKGSTMFVTKKIDDNYTCPKTITCKHHRNAYKSLIGYLVKEQLEDPNREYKPKDIIKYMVHIGGCIKGLEMLRGSPVESFEKLPYYCRNLEKKNPDTVTKIKVDKEGRFEMLFISIGVALIKVIFFMLSHIRTFRNHLRLMLRPMIIIDGAHLKSDFYNGVNLLAVDMDGNNQTLPIAYGICQGEDGPRWTWFLEQLKMCKAYTIPEFDSYLAMIQVDKPKAYKKLKDAQYSKWSRAHCVANRYNYLTSNSVESVNSLTRKARKLPVTMLMEFFRDLLQRCCSRFLNITDLGIFAEKWFKKSTYRATYEESINPVGDIKAWDTPAYVTPVLPPVLGKRSAGRPKNKDRIPSKGEIRRETYCTRCTKIGHSKDRCQKPTSSQRSAYGWGQPLF
ncbi:transposase, MuDR, MULE transposase domain protein [Artemisia annua]|uniref:Transposase, MuDR, MULE transposase domain protein n=1 Tax=Artemisia annua TaxID=35608 RepID=A0A2U1NZT8_ARTAN|nr:transposase, MuDR, MULE transposase domain protein [Artemisia annua]